MIRTHAFLFLCVISSLCLLSLKSKAQFVLNGSAAITSPECSDSSTTYLLTPQQYYQAGQIWYTTQVNLSQRFDIQFQLFLGNNHYGNGFTGGADGVCFVFQQQSNNAGGTGYALGYGGITPSIAAEFDTYQNGWDPTFCHTAIEKNGDVDHTDGSGNNLSGPVQLDPSNPNLPDGAWHNMEIIWNPNTQTISVYYDCIFRISYTGDIVDDIFGGNPNVYWGFTGSTGGFDNIQEVCIAHSYLNNPHDTSICPGNSVQLTCSGGVSYTWSPATGLNATTGSSVIASPDTTTTYIYRIINACGLIDSETVTIAVNSNLPITATPSPVSYCRGGSSTLTASGGSTYTWSPSIDLSATTGAIVIANPAVTTTYMVAGTNSSGCSGSDTIIVTVNPTPTITAAPSPFSYCPGGSSILSVLGGSTYTWSPSIDLSTTTGAIVTANPTITTMYTVTGIDSNGCSGSDTVEVTVNPTPTIAATSNPSSYCSGGSAILSVSGGSTYTWSPSTGLNATTGETVMADPTTSTTYVVTGINSGGCSGNDTVTVTVSLTPIITVTASPSSFCEGKNSILTASGGNNYTWYPSTNLSATTGATVSANPTTTTSYNVIGTNTNGCSGSDTVLVTVVQPIKFNLGDDTTICIGSSVLLYAPSGYSSYVWQNGSTLDSFNANSAGIYYVTVTDTIGCTGSDTSIVKFYPKDSINLGKPFICSGKAAILNAGNSFISYLWQNGATSQTDTVGTAGYYSVTVTDNEGCHTSDTVQVKFALAPVITLGDDTGLCKPFNKLLSPGTGFVSYLWMDSATSITVITPTYIVTEPGKYTVTVVDTNGCSTKDSIEIVNKCPEIQFPDAFTPSGEGPNTIFKGFGYNITSYDLRIYNRWGVLIFETTDIDNGWNGRYNGAPEPIGVYVYAAQYIGEDGITHLAKGNITLLR